MCPLGIAFVIKRYRVIGIGFRLKTCSEMNALPYFLNIQAVCSVLLIGNRFSAVPAFCLIPPAVTPVARVIKSAVCNQTALKKTYIIKINLSATIKNKKTDLIVTAAVEFKGNTFPTAVKCAITEFFRGYFRRVKLARIE